MHNEITKEITRIMERRNEVLVLAHFTDLRLVSRFLKKTKPFEDQLFSLEKALNERESDIAGRLILTDMVSLFRQLSNVVEKEGIVIRRNYENTIDEPRINHEDRGMLS